MIFKQYFIDKILAGTKTQTRRPNRGYYKVGNTYSIQPCRTCKGLPGVRLLILNIHEEMDYNWLVHNFCEKAETTKLMPVTQVDADAEGFESSMSFELAFWELYPKWDGKTRWVYTFHVVEVNE